LPAPSPAASVRPSGAQRECRHPLADAAHHPDRRPGSCSARRAGCPRVCGLSSSATPWRASRSERSRSFSASAREPRPLGVGRVAFSRALPRWWSADEPGEHREHEQRADAGQHRAQAPL
jgi:hypothetical protein